MDQQIPIHLHQKIQYLNQKIDQVNKDVKKSNDQNYKYQFIQFIDLTIKSLINIKNYSPDIPNHLIDQQQNINQQSYQLYSLKNQKQLIQNKLQQLNLKQKRLQQGQLELKLQNLTIQMEKLKRQNINKQLELKQQQRISNQKIDSLTKMLERLGKINANQQTQIEQLKKERDNAEKQYAEIKQKYYQEIKHKQLEKEIQLMKKFHSPDLKCKKIYTNCSQGTPSQQYVIVQLPVIFQVNKIVYGIKVGTQVSSKQIIYINDAQFFQNQQVKFSVNNGKLQIQYIKRKKIIIVQKQLFKKTSQILFMLFGKGDSITLHQ